MPSPNSRLTDQIEQLLATDGPLRIVSAGEPVLRAGTPPYEGQLSPALLARLIDALRLTMHTAPGVGLAAPQVGVPLRIAVIEDPATVPADIREARARVPQPFRVLINPSYTGVGPTQATFYEGCLSVPGYQAVVTRPSEIHLTGEDEKGHPIDEHFSGWPARIVQHETDHLDGMLYLDRAELRSLTANEVLAERWTQATPGEAAEGLGFELP
ncbi:peptide deformylase [Streptomyces sp. NPDC004539]|uniref:peptide deformylase n=1 Tax=Streptomyces sp. NPDC004539 TaxID=3154280 RepID=UPI0033B1E90D